MKKAVDTTQLDPISVDMKKVEVANKAKDEWCERTKLVILKDDVIAIDYGEGNAFSAQSKLSAVLMGMLEMQELQ